MLLFINGAPGTGKSTTAKLLQQQLHSPYIEFSDLREWHLLTDWSNQSKEEEQMAFENLIFVLKNYLKHNYENVIVTDLRDYRIKEIPHLFTSNEYMIFTLIVGNDEVLKKRVVDEMRDSGYKDFEKALAWNKREQERSLLTNEFKIDNTNISPEHVARKIVHHLNQNK